MGRELAIGTGLVCVGVAVAISQWFIGFEAITYGVRFWIAMAAIALCFAGVPMIVHAGWPRYRAPAVRAAEPETLAGTFSMQEASTQLYEEALQKQIPSRGAEGTSGGTGENSDRTYRNNINL